MPSQATFADTLAALMAQRGLGVTDLSKRTGISLRMIFRYREGTVVPVFAGKPTPNAHALASALGVDVEELLGAHPEALAS